MKTIVLIMHPNIDKSARCKMILDKIKTLPNITVHDATKQDTSTPEGVKTQ